MTYAETNVGLVQDHLDETIFNELVGTDTPLSVSTFTAGVLDRLNVHILERGQGDNWLGRVGDQWIVFHPIDFDLSGTRYTWGYELKSLFESLDRWDFIPEPAV